MSGSFVVLVLHYKIFLVLWLISVQSIPTLFSSISSQILLVTAMYLVRGTLEELTENLEPFCRRDCSSSMSGLLDKLMTHFFLMCSGMGLFLYCGESCSCLNFLICQFFTCLNNISLVLLIAFTMSLKSLILSLGLMEFLLKLI